LGPGKNPRAPTQHAPPRLGLSAAPPPLGCQRRGLATTANQGPPHPGGPHPRPTLSRARLPSTDPIRRSFQPRPPAPPKPAFSPAAGWSQSGPQGPGPQGGGLRLHPWARAEGNAFLQWRGAPKGPGGWPDPRSTVLAKQGARTRYGALASAHRTAKNPLGGLLRRGGHPGPLRGPRGAQQGPLLSPSDGARMGFGAPACRGLGGRAPTRRRPRPPPGPPFDPHRVDQARDGQPTPPPGPRTERKITRRTLPRRFLRQPRDPRPDRARWLGETRGTKGTLPRGFLGPFRLGPSFSDFEGHGAPRPAKVGNHRFGPRR